MLGRGKPLDDLLPIHADHRYLVELLRILPDGRSGDHRRAYPP